MSVDEATVVTPIFFGKSSLRVDCASSEAPMARLLLVVGIFLFKRAESLFH